MDHNFKLGPVSEAVGQALGGDGRGWRAGRRGEGVCKGRTGEMDHRDLAG